MATTFSSYLAAPIPQSAYQFDSSDPALPTKRPSSDLYYSSYGESQGTPTPNPRKKPRSFSRPGFSSDPNSPTFYNTPPSAQVPRQSSMEDSGDESDDVYDEFDLGDFTKEEIKAYEAMVGRGERLRDAAPPDKSWVEILEASYQASLTPSDRNSKGPAPVWKLPEELYELVRAGVSNGLKLHSASHDKISSEEEEGLEDMFMEEISAPTPQIAHLIQTHEFNYWVEDPEGSKTYLLPEYDLRFNSIESAQRYYEQDIYNLARSLGVPMEGAKKWVLRAREFLSKKNRNRPLRGPLPETFTLPSLPAEQSAQAPHDLISGRFQADKSPESGNLSCSGVSQVPLPAAESTFNVQDEDSSEIEDVIRLMTKNELEGPELLRQCQLRDSEYPDGHPEQDKTMPAVFRPPILDDTKSVDDIMGRKGKWKGISALMKEIRKQEAKEAPSRVGKAKSKTKKNAKRPVETHKRKGKHEHIQDSKGQLKTTSESEQLPKVKQLENEDQARPHEKMGRKRKRDKEGLSGEHHKHRKIQGETDAQDVSFNEIKSKRRGPQHSPFFQRSSAPKGKRTGKSEEQPMDFQPPMIQ